ncbi:hypothetical protein [Dokdonia sp.]|uniref:hypothetical protein n=1 Tax=Dokdonia sp. TaxID=2024995 RepID=UPI0032648DAE
MKLNLLVIRTQNPEALKCQYELLGMTFEHHKHDKGPYHYTSEIDGIVFEIYPFTKSMTEADGTLRLGLEVSNLKHTIDAIRNSNWIIRSDAQKMPWRITAIVQDLDGRKIELKHKEE